MLIKRKIYLALFVFIFFTISAALFSFHYSRVVDQFMENSEQSQLELRAATFLRAAVRNQILLHYEQLAADGSAANQEQLKTASDEVHTRLNDYENALKLIRSDAQESGPGRTFSEEMDELDKLREDHKAIEAALAESVVLRKSGMARDANAALTNTRERLFNKGFLAKLSRSIEAETSEVAFSTEGMTKATAALRWALLGVVILALLKSVLLGKLLSHFIFDRLSSLKNTVTKIQLGSVDLECPDNAEDEIGSIYEALKKMALELKQTNAELSTSHQKYRQIMESTSEGIWSIDDKLETIYVNPQMAKMLGFEASEIIGKSLDQFVDEKLISFRDEQIELEKTTGGNRLEFEFIKKDGTALPVMMVTNSMWSPEGKYLGSMAMVTDISELRRAEDQFRQAQKMEAIGQLAGGVAHDFNNILSVILLQTEMLLEMDPVTEKESFPAGVREIRDSAERAAGLTRQLLVFSRKKKLDPQQINLNNTISEMEIMIRRLVGEDIKVEVDLEEMMTDIKADPVQVQQVIMNLAVNASDAMPKGGNLTISTRSLELDLKSAEIYGIPAGPFVCLTISDSGCGISKEVQKRLFEPFFTTKEVGKGTGLGLATVFGIVKQSGGHISVYSEPGRGSSFKVYFPALACVLPQMGPKAFETGKPAISGTVLLIEDEPALNRVTHDALVSRGFRVCTAENGADALRKYGANLGQFDVVLTDVIMPEMNGPEFAQKFAEARHTHGIKVLFLSGFSDGKLEAHGISRNSDNFMEKPYSMKALIQKVSELVALGKPAA